MKEHFNIKDRLHTDVLEDTYGPITINVLRHTATIREAHLIDRKGISRTYAITFFPKKLAKEIAGINDEIKKGESIGKAFRKEGYLIRKNVIDVFIVQIPSWLQKAFKTKETYAKTRLSEFYACQKNKTPTIYGTVAEIYSPDFREASINNTDIKQMNPSTKECERVGITKKEIGNSIAKHTSHINKNKRYPQAKKASLDYTYQLKKKIRSYLEKK